jgi:hypothetical protein
MRIWFVSSSPRTPHPHPLQKNLLQLVFSQISHIRRYTELPLAHLISRLVYFLQQTSSDQNPSDLLQPVTRVCTRSREWKEADLLT